MDQETKDFFEKLYGTMQDGFKKVDDQFKKIDEQFIEVRQEINELKKVTTRIELSIENEINPKLDALFDGQTQTNERLDRIEKEVQKHEDIIIRKVL